MLFEDARHNDLQIVQQKIKYLQELIDKRRIPPKTNFSDEAYDNAVEIYKLLSPKTVVGYNKIRLGTQNDGGYVFLDAFPQNGIRFAYSFGISTYDPFSLDMVARGYDVWQYDGTISEPPYNHPRIHFRRFNISGEENPQQNERNLQQIIEENKHQNASEIILKCDIEGYEWPMLETVRTEDLMKFTQINVEFHGFQPIGNAYTRLLKKLNETHQVIHIHANNNSSGTVLKNFRFLPRLFEVSYVRRDSYQFTECMEEYPTKLDSPCIPGLQEVFIGNFNPTQISDPKEDLRNDQLARVLYSPPEKTVKLAFCDRPGAQSRPFETMQYFRDVFTHETTKELLRSGCINRNSRDLPSI
jgi:hypothetical protein